MHELTGAQRELADAYRVSTEYVDWLGNLAAVPPETVLAVLAALGVDASDPGLADEALTAYRLRLERRALPPCVVTRHGDDTEIVLHHEAGEPVQAWIELEPGTDSSVTTVQAPVRARAGHGTATPGASTLELPRDLPLGYHTLHARWAGGAASATVIVTPGFLGFPDRMEGRRAWGLAAQLYSVRSQGSWGVGDLADLRELAGWSASRLGADYILLNPLSAAEPVGAMEPSPYLPTSRHFVNPIYLRIEDIPEYADLPLPDRQVVDRLRSDVHAGLDGLDAIDRDTSWAAKRAGLRLVHEVPRTAEREAAYQAFVRREGTLLRDFATWCAVAEVHGTDWRHWPAHLRHPHRHEVTAFRDEYAGRVGFYCWLQWALDDQLSTAQAGCLEAGMALGVMHDLAVGVHPQGADAWVMQDTLARGVNVGAPPDAFNQVGQNWSQPPWRPDRLAELAYAPYRDLISRLLRHAGAVRIDHIIGLFRLWWIPEGATADRGTYVRYDHEAMIGILALEGHRAGAVVVGEDLGNVEPAARDYLEERGIVGTSLLWFERDRAGRPLAASRWREYSLASVTTHDLPPTAGYLAGDHVVLREALGLLTRPISEERAADQAQRDAWLDVLRHDGLLEDGAGVEDSVTALYAYLTRTPARLVCVALTDAVGDRRTQNQPGTRDEYPNWRVPLSGPDGAPMRLEDVMTSARAIRLAETVRAGLGQP